MCKIPKNEDKNYMQFISRHNVPLEIALDLTGFGKFNYLLLIVCCLSLLSMGMEMFGMSFIMTAATCDLQLTMRQKGILSAMPMIGIIFMSYPWGYITDTKGRRWTLMVSMSFGFFFSFLSSFSPSMIVLAIFKLLSVTFLSAANSSVYTLIGEFQPKIYRDKMLLFSTTGLMFISGINGLLALPVLTMLNFNIPIEFLNITYRPWRLLIIVLGIPSALSAILLLWIKESPKFLISQDRTDEALKVLRRVYSINTGDEEYNYPVDSILFEEKHNFRAEDSILQSMWKQCAPIFQRPIMKNTLILYYLQFCSYFVANAFTLWMPLIANKFLTGMENGVSNASRSFCSAIVYKPEHHVQFVEMKGVEICDDTIKTKTFWIVITLSAINCLLHFVCIFLVNSFGKKAFAISLMVATGACGFLINLVGDPVAGLVLFVILTYESLITGVIPAFAVEIYPTHVRGMSICLLVMVSRLGGILGTNLVGMLLDTHCEAGFHVYSFLMISCGLVAFFLPSDKKQKSNVYLPEVTRL